MNKTELHRLKSWFSQYTNQFSSPDSLHREAYGIKIGHSARVSRICGDIGRSLRLNDEDISLAETIGLFHDIGRFEQYRIYNTYLDKKSENHAELGVKVLQEYRLLEHLDSDSQDIIRNAISCHNRLRLPAEVSPRSVLFSKLIRDADKLDIFDLVMNHYRGNGRSAVIELDLPDEPGYSTGILSDLFAHQLVDMKKMRTLNDFKLIQMGWVYDLNFPITIKTVQERRYLEAIRKSLPASGEIDEALAYLNEYLERARRREG